MQHDLRVIFGDTDMMGVVYYANYLRFFEASRAAYLRHLGRSHRDLEEWRVALPVVESHCRHRHPAYYEDLLAIEVWVSQLRGASIRFDYEIDCAGKRLAEGYTVHACVHSESGAPRRMPPELRELIEKDRASGIS